MKWQATIDPMNCLKVFILLVTSLLVVATNTLVAAKSTSGEYAVVVSKQTNENANGKPVVQALKGKLEWLKANALTVRNSKSKIRRTLSA